MSRPIFTPQETRLLEDEIPLPMAYCVSCHKEVVVFSQLGQGARDGVLIWCCLLCEAEVMREEGGLKYVDASELTERGYRVVAPEAAKLHKEGGSDSDGGGGCGSCTTGCGSDE